MAKISPKRIAIEWSYRVTAVFLVLLDLAGLLAFDPAAPEAPSDAMALKYCFRLS